MGSGAPTPLPASFYDRPVLEVARDLVGCVVHHGAASGQILETEAYHESEGACHAYVGLTGRTRVLFGPAGQAYVYRSYGIHALLNAVCEADGTGAAVLIRALAPLTDVPSMRGRRGGVDDARLCDGPGKLAQALGVGLEVNDTSLVAGPVRITERPDGHEALLICGPRIGITKAADLPWRFCAAGERGVSRPWPPGLLGSDHAAAAQRRRGTGP